MCPEPVDRPVIEPVLGGAGPLGTCSKSLPRRGRYGWSEPGRELREVARSGGAGAAPAGVGRDGYGRGRPIPTGARGGFRARHTPVAGEAWETRSPRSAVLTEFGHLLDTFVVGEVLKQASSRGDPRRQRRLPDRTRPVQRQHRPITQPLTIDAAAPTPTRPTRTIQPKVVLIKLEGHYPSELEDSDQGRLNGTKDTSQPDAKLPSLRAGVARPLDPKASTTDKASPEALLKPRSAAEFGHSRQFYSVGFQVLRYNSAVNHVRTTLL